LVKGMLQVDPGKRLRAVDALECGWVKEGRERWQAVKEWWERKETGGVGDALGGGGWSVRERGRSKEAGQMLTMKEVMKEMLDSVGGDKAQEEAKEATEAAEATVRPLRQRRVKLTKALSVMDTKALLRRR